MSLSTEAAYLYSYSKEMEKIHKELKKLSKKIEHHAKKHSRATKIRHKEKHKKKHHDATTEIKGLIKKNKYVMKELHHHLIKFHEQIRRQGKKL